MDKKIKTKKLICHVCKREKKPYVVFLRDNFMDYLAYQNAREDGEICERCWNYFGWTEEFKDATDIEFEVAKKAQIFSNMILAWWEKDDQMSFDNHNLNSRKWGGTVEIKRWIREKYFDASRRKVIEYELKNKVKK